MVFYGQFAIWRANPGFGGRQRRVHRTDHSQQAVSVLDLSLSLQSRRDQVYYADAIRVQFLHRYDRLLGSLLPNVADSYTRSKCFHHRMRRCSLRGSSHCSGGVATQHPNSLGGQIHWSALRTNWSRNKEKWVFWQTLTQKTELRHERAHRWDSCTMLGEPTGHARRRSKTGCERLLRLVWQEDSITNHQGHDSR